MALAARLGLPALRRAQAKNNVSALELERHLGVSYPTAWLVKHKLMQGMFVREASRRLTGRVGVDDAYLGGEVRGGKPAGHPRAPGLRCFSGQAVRTSGRSDG